MTSRAILTAMAGMLVGALAASGNPPAAEQPADDPAARGTGSILAPTNGLVLYYSFDRNDGETVPDDSGNGHPGAVHGAMRTSDGVFGKALDLDGKSYLDSGVGIGQIVTGDVSVSAWVKIVEVGSTYRFIAGNRDAAEPSHGWELVVLADGSGNKPVFQCSTGSAGCSWTGASQIKDGKWHHLAGVRTGDAAHLYVDGRREKGEPTKAFGGVANQERMYIGRTSWCGTSGYLIGAVDEFRLYNRALTEQEVLVLYVNVGCETLAGDDEKKIASLIEQLGTGDPQARRSAKSKLKEMGRKALPVLMRYKDHQDPEIRATVEELLKP